MKIYIKILVTIAVLFGVYGYIVPVLVSLPLTVANIIAVTIGLLTPIPLYKFWIPSKQQNKTTND